MDEHTNLTANAGTAIARQTMEAFADLLDDQVRAYLDATGVPEEARTDEAVGQLTDATLQAMLALWGAAPSE